MWKKLLLAACLLMMSSLAWAGVHKHVPEGDQLTWFVVTDPEYGAVADAVAATGCNTGEETPMDCDGTAGSGTNDGPAITAAIAAAVSAGGGIVHMPCGNYRIGDTSFYDDGILIQGDNITLQGEGACTVLMPADVNGQNIISVCQNTASSCGSPNQVENIVLRDFIIKDDDPWEHGAKDKLVMEGTTVTAFDYQETVTFSGGSTGRFYWQSGTGAGPERLIFTDISPAMPVATETVAGDESGAGATIATVVSNDTAGEESHGILVANCLNCRIENVDIYYMGDEGIEIKKGSDHVLVTNSHFNTPGQTGGSAAVMVYEATNVEISNNTCEGGVGGGVNAGTRCFAVVGGTGGASNGVNIHNNVLSEKYDDQDDHSGVDQLITVGAQNGDIHDVSIQGNRIDLDNDNYGTCNGGADNGNDCDEDSDCDGYADTPPTAFCDNHNRNCAGLGSCSAIYVAGGSNEIYDVTISNNVGNGSIYAQPDAVSGVDGATRDANLVIVGNKLQAAHSYALYLDGANLTVNDNVFSGHGRGCLYVGTVTDSDGSFNNNTCSDVGDAFPAGAMSLLHFFDTSSVGEFSVIANTISWASGTGTIRGIDCQRNTEVRVIGNSFASVDDAAIFDCPHVVGNEVVTSGGV